MAAIVDSSDDAIISKTLEGVITSWNRGAQQIFGYDAEEAIGQSILLIIPEARLDEEAEVLRRLRRGEKIDHFETVRRAKDGRLVDVSLTVSPVRDATGRVIGASKVARDITERKRLDAERQAWLEKEQRARLLAERALQSRDEFLATVSHELRSPLNAIVGWVHLLKSGALDQDRTRRAIDTIARNAAVQGQLIADILDVQKLTSGRVRLNIQDIDLVLAVESALDSMRPAASAKDIALEPTSGAIHPYVSADPDRIQQVIWNLLSNAVKFTPSGGTVEVLLDDPGSHVEITVRDTGCGIRPDFMPYIFERFRQDAGDKSKGGLGLGLAIVRHLVELHGGSIGVTNNQPGPGASFTVRLPRAGDERVRAVATGSMEGNASPPQGPVPVLLCEVRVLVVDDEAQAREVVAAVLGQYGADVTLAASAQEALALVGRLRPHVVVSDIVMPDQDGYAFLRALRALPEDEGGMIPAVALTAAVTAEDRLSVLRAGFQFHLTKPADPIELVQAIASLARKVGPR